MAIGSGDIRFSVSGTITLGSTLPAIASTTTIDGSGQAIAVSGANAYQVLVVRSAATLNLNSMTLSDAYSNSSSGWGGAIYSQGTLIVSNSTVSSSYAPYGGGIFNDHGSLTVTDSTVNGNSAGYGGGIYNFGNPSGTGSTLAITNSTISGNNASSYGGVFNDGGIATVNSTTISGNSGGLVIVNNGTITLTNTILASNRPNCGVVTGTLNDGGYNISDDSSCGFGSPTGANGQTLGDNVNPLLDPNGLQNNGGPTETIALQSTSPAIDAIPQGNANCPGTDQRGAPRPAPGYTACDVGAFEYGTFLIATPTARSLSDSHGDASRNIYCDRHCHRDADCDRYSNGHRDPNCDSDAHCDSNRDINSYRDGNGNSDPYRDSDHQRNRHADGDRNSRVQHYLQRDLQR